MASIEEDIIDWIGTGTTAGDRVYCGSRIQSSTLPAIVVEVVSGRAAAFAGGTAKNLDEYRVTLKGVADNMSGAIAAVEGAYAALIAGIDAGSVVYSEEYRTIEEPVIGQGDEAEPAVATWNIVILHRT